MGRIGRRQQPDEKQLATALRTALFNVSQSEAEALDAAVKAGELVCEVKKYLKANPTILQTFAQWFAQNCKSYSLRSAHNYEICYKQTQLDSKAFYPNISACLKAWYEKHPKRKRMRPPTQEEREQMRVVDPAAPSEELAAKSRALMAEQETPELPEETPPCIGSFETWTDTPDLMTAMEAVIAHCSCMSEEIKEAKRVFRAFITAKPMKDVGRILEREKDAKVRKAIGQGEPSPTIKFRKKA